MFLLLLSSLAVLLIACSNGSTNDDGGSSDADSDKKETETMVETELDGEILASFPSEVFVADDAEIEHSVKSDLQTSFSYMTAMPYEELKEIFQDYVADTSNFNDYSEDVSEDSELGFHSIYLETEYEGDSLSFEITRYLNEDRTFVAIVRVHDSE